MSTRNEQIRSAALAYLAACDVSTAAADKLQKAQLVCSDATGAERDARNTLSFLSTSDNPGAFMINHGKRSVLVRRSDAGNVSVTILDSVEVVKL